MAPKVARGRGTGKGKNIEENTLFDILDEDNKEFFDDKCRRRIVKKQNFYKVRTTEELHLPEVLRMLRLNHKRTLIWKMLIMKMMRLDLVLLHPNRSTMGNHGVDIGNNSEVVTMLQNMQLQQNPRYEEELQWRADFETAQNK
ncbi:unnamed protein product [Vicia faba]|uniref:Uncharacterized protein n=1 Tax=Vicia faba TaxID=3906 RepID=A0AAV0ZER2_VICFA|nr:unnamed protein product [Vicia faba]